ncbi:MAG: Cys-tRNA(Pro) deacylase [Agathobacter sp.]|uniref:Cys-tRNA(Pro) deacylase n=1 Tax=Agathobacter sp. TaxID=2021311 RepID=UPI0004E217A5|nr:Cys-tRNA(Pro) deacylase [Agathobacter sp.]MBQ1682560.1 Cys-tRNA(Pro) deacylase [Agathobacter sp.]
MGKETKTNAMRILEKNKITYRLIHYECNEFTDGIHSIELSGCPVEKSYKTLVMQGKSKQYYVFVIPVAAEVDLKAAARAVSEKSVEMIPLKELTAITGYVRGGCSPIGMKKQFHTVIDESAANLDFIYISGGRIGDTIELTPADLSKVARANFAPVIRTTVSS